MKRLATAALGAVLIITRKRRRRSCSSKTYRDEDRRLPLRQLSVQHSEGRGRLYARLRENYGQRKTRA
jgi:hypothetical protein